MTGRGWAEPGRPPAARPAALPRWTGGALRVVAAGVLLVVAALTLAHALGRGGRGGGAPRAPAAARLRPGPAAVVAGLAVRTLVG